VAVIVAYKVSVSYCTDLLHVVKFYDSVSQTMVRETPVVLGGLPVGQRRSAGGFARKSIAKILSGTERMKNTPIHVCAKTAFVG
jgi:hypothetical protein